MDLAVTGRIETGMADDVRRLIRSGKLCGKKVYAMGHVEKAAEIDRELAKGSLQLTAVVDNNPHKKGDYFIDGKVYTVITADEFFSKAKEDAVILIYSVRFWREMADQMLRKGFRENENLFVLEALTLEKKIKYIRRGNVLREELRKRYGENVQIIVFHGPLGDNFLFMRMLRIFLKNEKIRNYVCLGTALTSKVAPLFSLESYHEISKENVMALEFLYMFLGDEASDIKILQIWEFAFHFNRCRIRFDRRFNFMDTFRSYVYGLKTAEAAENPVFRSGQGAVERIYEGTDLQKHETFIIAPYAYSAIRQPPKEFWIKLAAKLQSHGCRVAVNIDNKKEQNFIPETKSIYFDLTDSVPTLEYAGFFIGMRSGFCDITASAKCRKIILYPQMDLAEIDYDRHRMDFEFSSLKRMGLDADAMEIEFNPDGQENEWELLANWIVDNIV